MRKGLLKRIVGLFLAFIMVFGLLPEMSLQAQTTDNWEGKIISILGDSISTFKGYVPEEDGFNLAHDSRYPQDNLLTDVNETWWMQVLATLDAKLGINDSWRSTEVYNYIDEEVNSSYDGTKACMASMTRIQNLGSNGTPDVILFFGGTNDITQKRPLGTFDASMVPAEAELNAVKWDSVAEAYVAAIMRMQHLYPDTEIVAILPYYRPDNITDASVNQFNEVFISICEYFDVPYVDTRNCGISKTDLPDGTHPNAQGMDYITEAVLEVLLTECKVEEGEHIVYSVTHNLENVKTSRSYYKGVSAGCSFEETVDGENVALTVLMNSVDITDSCYANDKIFISEVTGNLVITANGEKESIYSDYLQALPEHVCSGLNLWEVLEPVNKYYTVNGWGIDSTGKSHSVTFAVNPGDQIWATSFQEAQTNGGTKAGIRLTWFDEKDVLLTLAPAETYKEFAKNGCMTAPEGAVAANVCMWNGNEDNEVYLLNREHVYEEGKCIVCGEAQPGPVIVKQPTDVKGALGEVVSVSVEAQGEGLKYQWYLKNAGSNTFSKSSIKEATYEVEMTKARAGREIYCVITDVNGTKVVTDTVKLIRVAAEELAIIYQPEDAIGSLGEEVSTTVVAQGEGLKYQWYIKNAGSDTFSKSSTKSATYKVEMTKARADREIYCVITDVLGNQVITDTVKIIRVAKEPLAILEQPVTVEGALGDIVSTTVKAQGEGLKYQWYIKNAGSDTFSKSSTKVATYEVEMTKARGNREIYCVITDALGNTVTTDTVKLELVK